MHYTAYSLQIRVLLHQGSSPRPPQVVFGISDLDIEPCYSLSCFIFIRKQIAMISFDIVILYVWINRIAIIPEIYFPQFSWSVTWFVCSLACIYASSHVFNRWASQPQITFTLHISWYIRNKWLRYYFILLYYV